MYPQPHPNPSIIWVQGIEGAKAFQLAPNSNALLMDSENEGIFYIKTSDNVGMCNLRIFKYEEMLQQPATQKLDSDEYVKRSELPTLIAEMLGENNAQSIQPAKPAKSKITK
jgi:hypothetical protein